VIYTPLVGPLVRHYSASDRISRTGNFSGYAAEHRELLSPGFINSDLPSAPIDAPEYVPLGATRTTRYSAFTLADSITWRD